MGPPCHAHRITHAAGEYAIAARLGIDLQAVGAVFFLVQTIFGDVAGRSNRDIERRTAGAGAQITAPAKLTRWAGQVKDLPTFGVEASCAEFFGAAQLGVSAHT